MARRPRRRPLVRLVLAVLLAAGLIGGTAASPVATTSALSRWSGGIDLYRPGVFTAQKTWLWCTAADVQIIRNIVDRRVDHATASQQRYFDYMRAHNRYRIPVSDGVDPAGWTAGLRRFVDSRYRLVASGSFDSALRSAVTNLRRTNLPVAITVSHGNHAWVLTGFTATADPAATSRFTVTSVRVVGPLWGLQSRTYGYDMRPDTKLTPRQLEGFFSPWHYAGVKMAWEGRWVSIQPVAAASAAASSPASTPKPSVRPTTVATPTSVPSITATTGPPSSVVAAPSPTIEPTPGEVAVLADGEPASSNQAASVADQPPTGASGWLVLPGVAAVVALVALGALVMRRRRRA